MGGGRGFSEQENKDVRQKLKELEDFVRKSKIKNLSNILSTFREVSFAPQQPGRISVLTILEGIAKSNGHVVKLKSFTISNFRWEVKVMDDKTKHVIATGSSEGKNSRFHRELAIMDAFYWYVDSPDDGSRPSAEDLEPVEYDTAFIERYKPKIDDIKSKLPKLKSETVNKFTKLLKETSGPSIEDEFETFFSDLDIDIMIDEAVNDEGKISWICIMTDVNGIDSKATECNDIQDDAKKLAIVNAFVSYATARREKREERLKKEAAEKAEKERARERSPPRRDSSHSFERKDRYGSDSRASYGSTRDNRYESRDSRGYGRDQHQTAYGRDHHQSGYGRNQPQQPYYRRDDPYSRKRY